MIENLSPKQIDFLCNSNSRVNIAVGSVRSGKSFAADLRFLKELQTGPQGLYMISGKSESSIVNNIIPTLRDLTGGLVRYKFGAREFSFLDKTVSIVGANDERAHTKIQGRTLAGAYVDEGTIIPETFFKMLLSRLSVENAKLFITCNPDSPYHWLKREYIDKAEELKYKVFNFRLDDNPSLSKEYVDALKREYQGLWYKRYIEGQWVQAEGAVYDFFDESIHVVKEPPTYAKYYIMGIDYGTTNPFAALLIGYNDDVSPCLWVEKEYYWDSKEMGYQKTDSEYMEAVRLQFDPYNVKLAYLDPAAASFEVEMKRHKKPVKQAKNEVLDGIRFVSALLTQGDLVICKRCTNLIKEMGSYVWDAKSSREGVDKPLKQRDHALDALRYALFTHFGTRHSLKETSAEERHKQEQERKWARNPMQFPGFTNSNGWQTHRG